MQVYWDYQEELTIQNELIFKRDKVVIPTALRADMLKAVHQPHLGGEASKRRAREVLFWPSIDRYIEKMVKSCSVCNRNRNQQPRETLKPHPVPSRQWQRIGVDLFTFHQRNYLITVDFYSGWFELDLISGMVASAVISKLKSQMARHGIPDVLISDNGPQFCCKQIKEFSQKWEFIHVTSSPVYPQSNGGVERAVQTAKTLMKKAFESGEDPYMSLLNHRNTPRDSVLGSPAQRLMSRRTKTILPVTEELLVPRVVSPEKVQDRVQHYKHLQKKAYDKKSQNLPALKKGDVVRIQEEKGFLKKGIVVQETNYPRSYQVKTSSGIFRRNRRHLLKVEEPKEISEESDDVAVEKLPQRDQLPLNDKQDCTIANDVEHGKQLTYTRSGRLVKKPDRLIL